MSYELLPNGKHHWNFRLGGGKGRRKNVTHSDFKEGEKLVRKMQYEFENGIEASSPKKGTCFYDICDGYLAEKEEEPGCTHQKKKTLTSQITCFKKAIPNHRLQDFHVKGHEAYNAVAVWMKTYLKSKNRLGGVIAPESVNRKFNTLRAIFNWAIFKGLMTENPCKRAKKFEDDDALPRFLEEKEIEALFGTARRQEFVNYCTLILNTGMRPGEALDLQIENIHLPQRVIAGFRQKNRKKLGTVPIKDSLVTPLLKMIGGRKSGSLLNYTPGMLREDAEYGIRTAGINLQDRPGTSKFTIYGLRHTFASHMLMSGEDLATVAKWLRNGYEICFKHYGHLTQKYLMKAGNSIDLVPKFQLKVVGDDSNRGRNVENGSEND
jgi:integrase/recombinase XerC